VSVSTDRLDPDGLAALEEERDFLLASIDDLDAERAAGDLGTEDHAALRDDYTARAAEVIRAIDERRAAQPDTVSRDTTGRRVAVVMAVAAVALLAGVLVAQASGRRQSGDTITGSGAVPSTPTDPSRRCIDLTSTGRAAEAITCYRAVLDDEPDNATALTYLGWTLVLSSGSLSGPTAADALAAGKDFLARAVTADPDLADPHAFRAIVAEREGRLADARAELDALDRLDPPTEIRALTAGLRDRVERGLRAGASTTTTTAGP